MIFRCEYGEGGFSESWDGRITKVLTFGSHYEMRILSRSSITVLFGRTYCGYFICIPDDEVSCQIEHPVLNRIGKKRAELVEIMLSGYQMTLY